MHSKKLILFISYLINYYKKILEQINKYLKFRYTYTNNKYRLYISQMRTSKTIIHYMCYVFHLT